MDSNLKIAAPLRDLASVQAATHSKWGYKRAAAAVMNLPVPIESLRQPDGTFEKIAHVGPSSTRVIREVLDTGSSPTVDNAVTASGKAPEIERRRPWQASRRTSRAPHAVLRSPADQTERMIAAVSHSQVRVLGHGRGRMFGSRPGITADWAHVFDAAAGRGVAIEIDGDPSRQDVDFNLARVAIAAGCVIALSSDAHNASQLRYIETAVAHARLAGVPKDRVINTWPWDRLLEWARRGGEPTTHGISRMA